MEDLQALVGRVACKCDVKEGWGIMGVSDENPAIPVLHFFPRSKTSDWKFADF